MKKILFFILSILSMNAYAQIKQKNMIDQIIWIVGNQPILLSDVEAIKLNAELHGQSITNPYATIPEQLAIQKLFLHQAAIDSIEVNENMVIKAANEELNSNIQALGGKENVELMTHRTIPQLKEQLEKQLRDKFLIQNVQQNIIKNIEISPAEVREYLKKIPKDSLPQIPTQVEVEIITNDPQPTRAEVERVENKLRDFARRINSGETDFSTLARLYSEDASARNGGELGYSGRGQWVPSFAKVAFSLTDPKKVSKIVKTEYGYHILQLIGKRGDKVDVRHILLKPVISDSIYDKTLKHLDSIAADIRNGKFSFENATSILSDDEDSKNNHGLMVNINPNSGIITSRFEMKDLNQDIAKVVDTMKVGEISKPFTTVNKKGQKICIIVKLKDRIPKHTASITEDFQKLKNIVYDKRKAERINQWIIDKLKSTYIWIDPTWRNFHFQYTGWLKQHTK